MVLFGLGSVAYFCLLLINSVAILNKERFLTPLGLTSTSPSSSLGPNSYQQGGGGYGNGFESYSNSQGNVGGAEGEVSMKMRAVALVDAVRTLMRSALLSFFPLWWARSGELIVLWICTVPLIPINIAVIVYEILFGTGF